MLIVWVAVLVGALVAALWSILSAFAVLRTGAVRRSRRAILIAMLVIGAALGLYLSGGLVWSSDRLRVFGFPLPWGVWQKESDGRWFDYVSPWSLFVPPINVVLLGGALALPIAIWGWWRKRRRGLAPKA